MNLLLASLDPLLGIAKTVLGIGGLIFVHELGHFLVGRACGVMAEAFSIGFGPVLFKWKPGETEYRISAVPLGGYVKFLGENPDERGELSPRSFHAATYPRKAAIMLAGVTMNLIAAVVLFLFAFRGGIEVASPVIGAVAPGSPADRAGIRPGDRVVEIDGHRILGFEDIQQETAFSDRVTLVVERDGARLPAMVIDPAIGSDGFRRLGVGAAADPLRIGVFPGGEAERAGVRDGDRPVSVGGKPVSGAEEAFEAHRAAVGDGKTRWVFARDGGTVEAEFATRTWQLPIERDALRIDADRSAEDAGFNDGDEPVSADGAPAPTVRTLAEALRRGSGDAKVVVRRGGAETTIAVPAAFRGRAASLTGPADGPIVVSPTVASLADTSKPNAARDAGMPAGATLVAVNGAALASFESLIRLTQEAGASGASLRLTWKSPSGDVSKDVEFRPAAESNASPELLGLGAATRSETVREESLLGAVALGIDRTHRTMMHIAMTLRSLVTGSVSPKKLSGPLAIAQISYRKSKEGLAPFFLFLGIISMNLAVLNVLPVPLLDGGQLALITIEKVRGKPLPERVLGAVQWTGLLLLLSFMAFVIVNDIRNFR